MSYPMSKYKFYYNDHKVVAVSTYAGKNVRGVAICSADDNFDLEKGKQLAAARCAEKIARKRQARAIKKFAEAEEELYKAQIKRDRMQRYMQDADFAVNLAEDTIQWVMDEMMD